MNGCKSEFFYEYDYGGERKKHDLTHCCGEKSSVWKRVMGRDGTVRLSPSTRRQIPNLVHGSCVFGWSKLPISLPLSNCTVECHHLRALKRSESSTISWPGQSSQPDALEISNKSFSSHFRNVDEFERSIHEITLLNACTGCSLRNENKSYIGRISISSSSFIQLDLIKHVLKVIFESSGMNRIWTEKNSPSLVNAPSRSRCQQRSRHLEIKVLIEQLERLQNLLKCVLGILILIERDFIFRNHIKISKGSKDASVSPCWTVDQMLMRAAGFPFTPLSKAGLNFLLPLHVNHILQNIQEEGIFLLK